MMEEHGWRNGHEAKPNGNYGRDKTAVSWVELVILPLVLLKVVQELVVVPQIQCIAVCHGKTSSINLECSETVEVPKSAVQRWDGQCPCRDAEVILTPFKTWKKKLGWILERALWRARLHVQWKLCCVNFDLSVNPDQCRHISTTFFSHLLVVTSFVTKFPFPLFHYIPP